MSPERCFVTLIHCIQRTSGFIDIFLVFLDFNNFLLAVLMHVL